MIPDDKVLQKIVAAIIGAAVSCELVVLFGSGARGQMNENSDLDLLVVLSGRPLAGYRDELLLQLMQIAPRIDLVVVSSDEFQTKKDQPQDIVGTAFNTGRTLYRGPTA